VVTELEIKTDRIQQMLSNEGLDGVLLNAQHNFSWLSGGSNGIDMTRENGAGFLFVTRSGERYVIANNIEMPRLLTEQISEYDFNPIEVTWQAEKDPHTILNAAKSVTNGSTFGCDVGFSETSFIEPLIAECRYELTQEEIDRYKQLGQDAGKAVGQVILTLIPGMTENAIAQIVRDALQGLDIFSCVTLVGSDERIAKYRHPVPTDKVWTKTLLIVVCARRHGLVASFSRLICAGAVPDELSRRTEACAAVNAALYDATRAGVAGSQLYDVAAAAYVTQGFAGEIDKHHQGGAAGYRTRDWVAHPASKDVVRPNQAFAWNPSITGTKTEETAILIDDELQVITTTDGFPTITTVIEGTEFYSPGILSLSKGASA
jgi:Xaa-Pro dipeptidase